MHFFDSYCFSGHRKNQSCKFFVRTHSRLITNLLCISPPCQGLMKIHKGISIISSPKINPEMRLMNPQKTMRTKKRVKVRLSCMAPMNWTVACVCYEPANFMFSLQTEIERSVYQRNPFLQALEFKGPTKPSNHFGPGDPSRKILFSCDELHRYNNDLTNQTHPYDLNDLSPGNDAAISWNRSDVLP